MKKNLIVQREVYEKEGKKYYNHVIKDVVQGRNVVVHLKPKDIGGYTVLDIIFGDLESLPLVVKPFKIEDGKNIIEGNSYSVSTCDSEGNVYECGLKPSQSSSTTSEPPCSRSLVAMPTMCLIQAITIKGWRPSTTATADWW